MAQLSKIVSSILRDMIMAQHEANIYAASLSDAYRKNGRMEHFQLPTVAFGEIELGIKYGVKNVAASVEHTDIDYLKLKRVCSNIASEVASVVVNSVILTVTSGKDGESRMDTLLRKFNQEVKVNNRFQTFLSRKIFDAYCNDFANLVDSQGKFNTHQLIYISLEVSMSEFVDHKDMLPLIQPNEDDNMRLEVKDSIKDSLSDFIPELVKNTDVGKKSLYPSLEVEVGTDELAKYPADCIHTFQFKVIPNYQPISHIDNESDMLSNTE